MSKVLSNFFLLIKQLSLFVIYFLSFLFPRNKKIWLYGNYNGSFRDNSKYLYLYGIEHYPKIKHIWISPIREVVAKLRSLGYPAFYKYSISALFYALVAKVYIYNIYSTSDIFNGSFRGSAFLFNCWHGVPFKKIGYDVTTGPLQPYYTPRNIKEKYYSFLREPITFRLSSAVLVTSENLRHIFSKALLVPEEKVFVAPYPRNSVFNWGVDELISFINRVESRELQETLKLIKAFSYVIIYMPTWRDANPDFMNEAIPDFDRLEEACTKNDCIFLIKSHVSTSFSVDLKKYRHIKNLDSRVDVYPLLPFTDALVSDYSSIIFDYSLLKKKIIFYDFDKEDYLSKSREAYFNYNEVFTDRTTPTFDGLLKEIDKLAEENKITKQSYDYPLSRSFMENTSEMKDIFSFIKASINY